MTRKQPMTLQLQQQWRQDGEPEADQQPPNDTQKAKPEDKPAGA